MPTLVSSTLPELLDDAAAWEFARAGIATAAGLRTGLRCAAARLRAPADAARLREIAAAARALGRGAGRRRRTAGHWLAEHEAKALLRAGGVSVPDGRVVAGEDDAVAALAELGGRDRAEAELAGRAAQVRARRRRARAGTEDRGAARLPPAGGAGGRSTAARVLAERMAGPGLELIVAARTDGVVPALVLGLGGIWTELLDDVAIVPLPAGAARIEARAALAARRAAAARRPRRRGASTWRRRRGWRSASASCCVEQRLELVECNPVLVGGGRARSRSMRRSRVDADGPRSEGRAPCTT